MRRKCRGAGFHGNRRDDDWLRHHNGDIAGALVVRESGRATASVSALRNGKPDQPEKQIVCQIFT